MVLTPKRVSGLRAIAKGNTFVEDRLIASELYRHAIAELKLPPSKSLTLQKIVEHSLDGDALLIRLKKDLWTPAGAQSLKDECAAWLRNHVKYVNTLTNHPYSKELDANTEAKNLAAIRTKEGIISYFSFVPVATRTLLFDYLGKEKHSKFLAALEHNIKTSGI